MPASPKDNGAQDFLCQRFWKESFDDVVRVYARALAGLVHDVLQKRSQELHLSTTDLENSDKLLNALLDEQSNVIEHILQAGNSSRELRRFVICIMRRLANIQIKKDSFPNNPEERFPWIGMYYDFLSRPDILDRGNFFPQGEMLFFQGIFKKK